jgi:uncharacterized protein YjeT (DUF2065 family)
MIHHSAVLIHLSASMLRRFGMEVLNFGIGK